MTLRFHEVILPKEYMGGKNTTTSVNTYMNHNYQVDHEPILVGGATLDSGWPDSHNAPTCLLHCITGFKRKCIA